MPLLDLNEATLFYYNLSSLPAETGNKSSRLIKDWATKIPQQLPASNSAKSTVGSHTLISLVKTKVSSEPTLPQGWGKTQVALEHDSEEDQNIGCFSDDGDDTKEREAALASPPKGKKRLTSSVRFYFDLSLMFTSFQGIVRIQGATKSVKTEAPIAKHSGVKYKNSDLPDGCLSNNVWRRIYVPTYLTYVASYDDPWTLKDSDGINAMQCIWDDIYGHKVKYTIKVNDAVFNIVRASFECELS